MKRIYSILFTNLFIILYTPSLAASVERINEYLSQSYGKTNELLELKKAGELTLEQVEGLFKKINELDLLDEKSVITFDDSKTFYDLIKSLDSIAQKINQPQIAVLAKEIADLSEQAVREERKDPNNPVALNALQKMAKLKELAYAAKLSIENQISISQKRHESLAHKIDSALAHLHKHFGPRRTNLTDVENRVASANTIDHIRKAIEGNSFFFDLPTEIKANTVQGPVFFSLLTQVQDQLSDILEKAKQQNKKIKDSLQEDVKSPHDLVKLARSLDYILEDTKQTLEKVAQDQGIVPAHILRSSKVKDLMEAPPLAPIPPSPQVPTPPIAPSAPEAPPVPNAPPAPSVPEAPLAPSVPSAPPAPPVPTAPPNVPKAPLSPSVPSAPPAPPLPNAVSLEDGNDPNIPLAPAVPSAPPLPSVPLAPSVPSAPQAPPITGVPQAPMVPSAPLAPSVPSAPEAPVAPPVPGAPTAPQTPVAPIPSTDLPIAAIQAPRIALDNFIRTINSVTAKPKSLPPLPVSEVLRRKRLRPEEKAALDAVDAENLKTHNQQHLKTQNQIIFQALDNLADFYQEDRLQLIRNKVTDAGNIASEQYKVNFEKLINKLAPYTLEGIESLLRSRNALTSDLIFGQNLSTLSGRINADLSSTIALAVSGITKEQTNKLDLALRDNPTIKELLGAKEEFEQSNKPDVVFAGCKRIQSLSGKSIKIKVEAKLPKEKAKDESDEQYQNNMAIIKTKLPAKPTSCDIIHAVFSTYKDIKNKNVPTVARNSVPQAVAQNISAQLNRFDELVAKQGLVITIKNNIDSLNQEILSASHQIDFNTLLPEGEINSLEQLVEHLIEVVKSKLTDHKLGTRTESFTYSQIIKAYLNYLNPEADEEELAQIHERLSRNSKNELANMAIVLSNSSYRDIQLPFILPSDEDLLNNMKSAALERILDSTNTPVGVLDFKDAIDNVSKATDDVSSLEAIEKLQAFFKPTHKIFAELETIKELKPIEPDLETLQQDILTRFKANPKYTSLEYLGELKSDAASEIAIETGTNSLQENAKNLSSDVAKAIFPDQAQNQLLVVKNFKDLKSNLAASLAQLRNATPLDYNFEKTPKNIQPLINALNLVFLSSMAKLNEIELTEDKTAEIEDIVQFLSTEFARKFKDIKFALGDQNVELLKIVDDAIKKINEFLQGYSAESESFKNEVLNLQQKIGEVLWQ